MEEKKRSIKDYWPLMALTLIALLAACALESGFRPGGIAWMHAFMGMFLCQFSLVKLFDIPKFADGFQMYDLIAKRSRAYALAYPFIELGLGLAYLSFFIPLLTYLLTILVMGVGIAGVVKALREGLDIRCSCMGSVLSVPLSTVTLAEDGVMAAMALGMLLL